MHHRITVSSILLHNMQTCAVYKKKFFDFFLLHFITQNDEFLLMTQYTINTHFGKYNQRLERKGKKKKKIIRRFVYN